MEEKIELSIAEKYEIIRKTIHSTLDAINEIRKNNNSNDLVCIGENYKYFKSSALHFDFEFIIDNLRIYRNDELVSVNAVLFIRGEKLPGKILIEQFPFAIAEDYKWDLQFASHEWDAREELTILINSSIATSLSETTDSQKSA